MRKIADCFQEIGKVESLRRRRLNAKGQLRCTFYKQWAEFAQIGWFEHVRRAQCLAGLCSANTRCKKRTVESNVLPQVFAAVDYQVHLFVPAGHYLVWFVYVQLACRV